MGAAWKYPLAIEGRESQAGALQYVVDEQGEPMALFIADGIRTWRDVVNRSITVRDSVSPALGSSVSNSVSRTPERRIVLSTERPVADSCSEERSKIALRVRPSHNSAGRIAGEKEVIAPMHDFLGHTSKR